ncbi:MBL fold metallo-hydrolase [Halobaculum marinum]|uniref:MBL fold metallo-hydrolase n=1 Tax=Halobaculum marinum TaxID=3031996 RepID=A0ABD5WZY0_9EURY|nr:MBL fold metallo-hydrolase [Halobaculum sp. DT55]
MKVTYLESAAILVETDDVTILCDPWLLDGAYYGSWAHYPEPPFEPEDFNDVDYIYVSHVHPDHFHPPTLERLDTDIPILIHDYRWDYLRDAVEDLGFEAIELADGERFALGGDTEIAIHAADGCDPERCGNFFGCTWYDSDADTPGSTQVDSMAVISDGGEVLVDTNDCPYSIALPTCERIKQEYGEIDMLCHQYSAAQFYPQAVTNYDHDKKIAERDRVIQEKYEIATQFIDLFDPTYYMPFAGEYVLAGNLAHLNEYTANPPRADAKEFFDANTPPENECVFLNSGEWLDVTTGEVSAPFQPSDPAEKQRYIEEELAPRSFDYEADPRPTLEELQAFVEPAYEHMEAKRLRIGYETETTVLIPLVDDVCLELSMDGSGFDYTTALDTDAYDRWVKLDVDPRLLARLFESPHEAYWADAKIGSHVGISKKPDVYERGLFNVLGSFHTDGAVTRRGPGKQEEATSITTDGGDTQ